MEIAEGILLYQQLYCCLLRSLGPPGHACEGPLGRWDTRPTPCLGVKRDAHTTTAAAEWLTWHANIWDAKRAVNREIVRGVYYGPSPRDFITDIFFALIESAIDGVDSGRQKPRLEGGGDAPAVESFIMNGTPTNGEIYVFSTGNEEIERENILRSIPCATPEKFRHDLGASCVTARIM